MILTEAQKKIVKYICEMEFKTLEEILIQPDLGETEMGITYENFLALYGATRHDFDKEIVDTHNEFKKLSIDPTYVFVMEPIAIKIFKQILQLNEQYIKEVFPKALSNLWNKLFLIDTVSSINN